MDIWGCAVRRSAQLGIGAQFVLIDTSELCGGWTYVLKPDHLGFLPGMVKA
jgi:hypothetical protein